MNSCLVAFRMFWTIGNSEILLWRHHCLCNFSHSSRDKYYKCFPISHTTKHESNSSHSLSSRFPPVGGTWIFIVMEEFRELFSKAITSGEWIQRFETNANGYCENCIVDHKRIEAICRGGSCRHDSDRRLISFLSDASVCKRYHFCGNDDFHRLLGTVTQNITTQFHFIH